MNPRVRIDYSEILRRPVAGSNLIVHRTEKQSPSVLPIQYVPGMYIFITQLFLCPGFRICCVTILVVA